MVNSVDAHDSGCLLGGVADEVLDIAGKTLEMWYYVEIDEHKI